ncbi:hypothetical protein D3C87_816090 [compost metagenome]
MRRLLLLIPLLVTACSGPVDTLILSGQVRLPLSAASAFRIDGCPVLISNFDGTLGKVKATTLDAGGKFTVRIERASLPEAPQWFKLLVMHPDLNGPMLSRALVLSRGGNGAEKLEVSPYSSLTQMAIEYQFQLDPTKVPVTLSPTTLEDTFVTRGDAFLLDNQFHISYGQYASGSTKVAPAADSEMAADARELLFREP